MFRDSPLWRAWRKVCHNRDELPLNARLHVIQPMDPHLLHRRHNRWFCSDHKPEAKRLHRLHCRRKLKPLTKEVTSSNHRSDRSRPIPLYSSNSKIAGVMWDQFRLKPKEPMFMYWKPYPEAYDQIAMPPRYIVDNMATIEHISKFLIQCGEASSSDAPKIRLFPLSLSGSAFA